MKNSLSNENGFLSLLGLLLAMAIIFFLGYKIYGAYLLKPSVDTRTKNALSQEGLSSASNTSSFDSMTQRVKDINKAAADQYKQIDEMK